MGARVVASGWPLTLCGCTPYLCVIPDIISVGDVHEMFL